MDQFIFYFKLGLFHVLSYQAYDHILFLTVLTVPYVFKDWKRAVVLVSIFTLGHTLSLILSTYGLVQVKEGLVEFLVLITIFISASYNLISVGKVSKGLGLIFFATLFFGIIHGLAFANDFKLMIGSGSKLLPLLEFALGIEGAQFTVVLAVLVFGFLARKVFRFSKCDWILVASSVVIGVMIPMLIKNWPW